MFFVGFNVFFASDGSYFLRIWTSFWLRISWKLSNGMILGKVAGHVPLICLLPISTIRLRTKTKATAL